MQQQTADTAVARRGHMWGLMIPCCMQSAVKLIPQIQPSSSFGERDIQVHSSWSQTAIFQQNPLSMSCCTGSVGPSAQHCTTVPAKIPFLSADSTFLTNPRMLKNQVLIQHPGHFCRESNKISGQF